MTFSTCADVFVDFDLHNLLIYRLLLCIIYTINIIIYCITYELEVAR